MKKAYLKLENGTVFEGIKAGADCGCSGDVVFVTSVVGYLETLTDPAYSGKIVVQTFPVIGIYGVIPEDLCGSAKVAGYAVRELCDTPSNFRSEYGIEEYLEKEGIPCITGIDTRELTRILRDGGVMKGCICDDPGEYKEIL